MGSILDIHGYLRDEQIPESQRNSEIKSILQEGVVKTMADVRMPGLSLWQLNGI